jgi:2-desacetyl-2-hydroxyethyl bacteriochlorophyllide A dehydrogenase
MRALVLHGPDDVRCERVADPTLGDRRGAIVRITRTSICGSDLHLVHGTVPTEPGTIIGHEGIGVVEEVGADVRRFRKGQRVIVPGVVGCGDCDTCRRGYPVGCLNQFFKVYGTSTQLPGAQAELLAVPGADLNLWPAPDDLDDEQVLFLTDILPTGYFAAENARITPGATVVVIGCGPVGLFAVLAAQLFGAAQVVAIDRIPYRLARAAACGATAIDARREDVRTRILELTDGRGASSVIEAVGAAETVALALDLVAIGGVVSVVGVIVMPDFPFPMGTALMKDITFRIGLVNVPRFIPILLPLIRAGKLDPTALITHRLPLSDGRRAYELFSGRQDGCVKIALTP